MKNFENINALIIDMDGVLWEGGRALPGLADFFDTLHRRRFRYILATNNASLTPEQYVAKLAGFGVTVERRRILTSAMATALYLSERMDPKQTRVFVIGEDGAKQPLLDLGFALTELYEVDEGHRADIVVCGLDRTLSWDKLSTATLNILAGARFIGTNADTTLPMEQGLGLGNGAVLAALQAATGVAPITIGKPEPIIYRQAMALLGSDPAQTVAIGDRLDTDILGAIRTGIRSLLVLTGVATEQQLAATEHRPTWVMPDLRAVTQALDALPENSD
ncbi:MAG: haloacid dehalogenase [Gammaproteobacteria bacterium HGW-Gammaproteobacteria-3]|nr:MAG: haloacid dehalogenase [Gammaproteobacteria bacterium HGW-Gammaproteobacteria-3]